MSKWGCVCSLGCAGSTLQGQCQGCGEQSCGLWAVAELSGAVRLVGAWCPGTNTFRSEKSAVDWLCFCAFSTPIFFSSSWMAIEQYWFTETCNGLGVVSNAIQATTALRCFPAGILIPTCSASPGEEKPGFLNEFWKFTVGCLLVCLFVLKILSVHCRFYSLAFSLRALNI